MIAFDFTDTKLTELLSLRGRAAIITGGASGIGLAIARRLAEAGAAVGLADLDRDRANMAAASLAREFGVPARGFEADVAQESAVVALADNALEIFCRLDIWVNNAAVYPVKSSLDLTMDEWDRIHALNLRGVFVGSREAARRMIVASRPGVVINIASVSGFRGRPKMASYVASKHGVVGLTKSLAAEWGPAGVRVLGIAPTLVATPGMEQWRTGAARSAAGHTDELEKRITAEVPLGRIGLPDDIARVALFCASDLSALMTGSTLPVDAGAMCY